MCIDIEVGGISLILLFRGIEWRVFPEDGAKEADELHQRRLLRFPRVEIWVVDESLAVHVHVLLLNLHVGHRGHIANGAVCGEIERQPHRNRNVVRIRPILNRNGPLQFEQLLLRSIIEHVVIDAWTQGMDLVQ